MKYIKGFNESLNSKKELRQSIILFLIHNERELKIMFDNYTIEKGEYHWEIVAKTKADHSGYKPPMDEVRFPMYDFFTWVSKQSFRGDVLKVKYNLFKEIFDNYGSKAEPDELDSKLLDSILNQFGVWEICLSTIKSIRKTISKYDIDDIDDRCLEYFDELSGWKPEFIMGYQLAWIYHSLVNDDIYETWWLLDQINQTCVYDAGFSEFDFLKIVSSHIKPCINIKFNAFGDSSQSYGYDEVQKVAVGIYNRLSKLYPISKVSYHSDEHYPQINKKLPLHNYKLVLYIE